MASIFGVKRDAQPGAVAFDDVCLHLPRLERALSWAIGVVAVTKDLFAIVPDDVGEGTTCKSHSGSVAAHDPAVAVEQGDRVAHGIECLAPFAGGCLETYRCLAPVSDVLEIADDGHDFAGLIALGRAIAVKDVLAAIPVDHAELNRWRFAGLESLGASRHEPVHVVGMDARLQPGHDIAVELASIDVEQFEQLL